MTSEDYEKIEEAKVLRTYYEDTKDRKQREFNIKVRRQSRDTRPVSISKPKIVGSGSSVFKCQFCSMILFNTRDVQVHDTHAKTFSQNFFNPKEMISKNGLKEHKSNCSFYFILQKEWITEYDGNAGRILCPRKT